MFIFNRFAMALLMAAIALSSLMPLISVHAQPVVVATGAYPEGLLWHGGRLFFAEMGADRVSVIDGTAQKEFWREAGCGPTAISPFRGSAFLVNCHLGKRLVEISADGVTTQRFQKAADGGALRAPNASVSDGQGGVFFSDSGIFSLDAPAQGRVFHLSANDEMTELLKGLRYANGVAFDAISRTLYVSEHLARRILALQLDASHQVISTSLFADFSRHEATKTFSYALAGPDGIALMPGLLAVAEYGEGRVHWFDRAGKHLKTLNVAMPFVDTVVWDSAGHFYAGGAFSNTRIPYEGQVLRFPMEVWRP